MNDSTRHGPSYRFFERLRQHVIYVHLFGRKSKSTKPSPDWSDERLFEALEANSGSMMERVQNHAVLWREAAQQAILVKYQRRTARVSLWVGIGAVTIGIISVGVSVWLPVYQHNQAMQSELSALYRAIDANGDIFVGNYNNMRFLMASDTIATLPDRYVNYDIPDELAEPLQQKLGMINYTWLLYYVEETELLNQTRGELNTSLIAKGATSLEYTNAKKLYLATTNYLGTADGYNQTKFNYVTDTGCLQYLLQEAFDSIPVSEFDKTVSCSNDSLNRIFYWFGYLPPLTPNWMFPLLRDALNQREAGLGNQLIPLNTRF